MRRGRGHGGGNHKPTISVAILAGLASPVVRTVSHGMEHGITGPEGAVDELTRTMTGFSPYTGKFEGWRMKYGLLPVVAGVMVHKIAGMLGLNRAIARAGIPLIRI